MKFDALIVETNPQLVNKIETYLAQTGCFETPYVCQNATQAISAVNTRSFDLLLLGIDLPDMSGLELIQTLPHRLPTIVVSSNAQHAADCYDYDVADFLLDTFVYARFIRAFHRALPISHQRALPLASSGNLLSDTSSFTAVAPQSSPADPASTQSSKQHLPYFFLKTGRNTERFVYEEILFLEAYSIYSKLITINGVVVVNQSFTNLFSKLNSNHFIRVHRSYIVNLNKVTKFSNNTIWIGSHKIPIGISFKRKVYEQLGTLNL